MHKKIAYQSVLERLKLYLACKQKRRQFLMALAVLEDIAYFVLRFFDAAQGYRPERDTVFYAVLVVQTRINRLVICKAAVCGLKKSLCLFEFRFIDG